ncbi:hypothetical protein B0H13DRAFT_1875971 [Mycena leptocephala]|nr:hypothetical protein B0H13DRAFT_1875971 [Mycena leptocephala]
MVTLTSHRRTGFGQTDRRTYPLDRNTDVGKECGAVDGVPTPPGLSAHTSATNLHPPPEQGWGFRQLLERPGRFQLLCWKWRRVFGVLQWCLEGAEGAEVEALIKEIPDVENFAANLYKGPQEIIEEGPRKRNQIDWKPAGILSTQIPFAQISPKLNSKIFGLYIQRAASGLSMVGRYSICDCRSQPRISRAVFQPLTILQSIQMPAEVAAAESGGHRGNLRNLRHLHNL